MCRQTCSVQTGRKKEGGKSSVDRPIDAEASFPFREREREKKKEKERERGQQVIFTQPPATKNNRQKAEKRISCILVGLCLAVAENVIVLLPDSAPLVTSIFEDQILVEGQSLDLECSASGTPRPEVRWMRDDKVLVRSVPLSFTFNSLVLLIFFSFACGIETREQDLHNVSYKCCPYKYLNNILPGIHTRHVHHDPSARLALVVLDPPPPPGRAAGRRRLVQMRGGQLFGRIQPHPPRRRFRSAVRASDGRSGGGGRRRTVDTLPLRGISRG